VEDLILSEVNIKHIEYIDDTSGIVVKSVKPNFALLGKRFGPKLKAISAIINTWGKEEISQIEKNGILELTLEGEKVSLTLDDVLISSQDIPGWSVASSDGLTVALDVTLTDELKQEGIYRDLVNRIQNLRKDMGLEVQDKITIKIAKHDDLVNAALENFAHYIKTETQALSLEVNGTVSDAIVLDMDDFELSVRVKKA
jgi:isoleucyl-tRNA synthetase